MKEQRYISVPKIIDPVLQNNIKIVKSFLSSEEVANLLLVYDGPMAWLKGRSGDYYRGQGPRISEGMMGKIISSFSINSREFKSSIRWLKMPEGSSLSRHVDDNGRMLYQVLIMLQPSLTGGVLKINDTDYPTSAGDAIGFNANFHPHEVSKIIAGERKVLSVVIKA